MRPVLLLIGLLLIGLLACAPPMVAAPPAQSRAAFLRVVTWNVRNLFDEIDDLSPPGDEDLVPTHAEVEAKLARLAAVLARLDPDVAILQEVENAALLERLAAGTLAGLGYRPLLREGRDPRGIDVGALVRVPFEPGQAHLDDRGPDGRHLWSRDVLEIRVPLPGREIVILGAHLVSRLDPAEDERRRQQAARLREIVDGVRGSGPEPAVLLVGDLNDVPDSAALAPLLGDGAIVGLGANVPATQAWTWAGLGAHERIDYALVSRADRNLVVRAEIVGGPDIDAASDHRPLLVDLWVGRQQD